MINDLSIVCLIIAFLYVWFETDAVLEYIKLFRIKKFKYEDFERFKKEFPSMSFFNFLIMNHNGFFVQLFTCPMCVSVWANLLGLLFFENKLAVGVYLILSWVGYFSLTKFLKFLNE